MLRVLARGLHSTVTIPDRPDTSGFEAPVEELASYKLINAKREGNRKTA